MKIHHMTIIQYFDGDKPWISKDYIFPEWEIVEDAIKKMDNYYFPLIQLNTKENNDDDDIFNIIGGDGRWTVFQLMGDWQYINPNGKDDEVRLWESDQGLYCEENKIIYNIEQVILFSKKYYETGSYEELKKLSIKY